MRFLRQALAPHAFRLVVLTIRARPSSRPWWRRERQMRTLRWPLVLGIFAVLTASACALRSPSIADLQYNPGRYYNRNVNVEGVVTSSWGVPLVPLKVYKVG